MVRNCTLYRNIRIYKTVECNSHPDSLNFWAEDSNKASQILDLQPVITPVKSLKGVIPSQNHPTPANPSHPLVQQFCSGLVCKKTQLPISIVHVLAFFLLGPIQHCGYPTTSMLKKHSWRHTRTAIHSSRRASRHRTVRPWGKRSGGNGRSLISNPVCTSYTHAYTY